MSLVDYGSSSSSSDDEEEEEEETGVGERGGEEAKPNGYGAQISLPATSLSPPAQQNRSLGPPPQQSHSIPPAPPSVELPDASMLFDSPASTSHQISGSNHSSRVAAAMVERASQKRESNGSLQYPRSKHPRGNLPHSRNFPDTVGGLLIPPQLHGRSNVVTEDINRLFVNRRTEPSG